MKQEAHQKRRSFQVRGVYSFTISRSMASGGRLRAVIAWSRRRWVGAAVAAERIATEALTVF
jgi:hypothetical protein